MLGPCNVYFKFCINELFQVYFCTGLLQAGPMEEGIAPAVASERLAIFQAWYDITVLSSQRMYLLLKTVSSSQN